MTTTIEYDTDEQIAALEVEAGAAGDAAMVAICRRALDGDTAARAECARVIDDARAQGDEYHVTRQAESGDLYGHPTTRCDPAGCAGGYELRLGQSDDAIENAAYEIRDGRVIAQLVGDEAGR